MAETVTNRLGVAGFGSDEVVGNLLVYPRRIVADLFAQLFVQEDFFTPQTAAGTKFQRNPFLLKYEADGVTISKDSRLVIADYGSEYLLKEEARPRIIVERGSGSFGTNRLTTQNFKAFSGTRDARSFEAYFDSTIMIRCVSRAKLESESLAAIVMLSLTFFNDRILKESHLETVSMPQVGTTTMEKASGDSDQWVTPVQVSVSQTLSWDRLQINPAVLNTVNIQVAL